MNKIKSVIALCLTFILSGCNEQESISKSSSNSSDSTTSEDIEQDDVVILATNDIHCGINDGITLAGLNAYKKEVLKHTPYVSLVDSGDLTSGSYYGTLSNGNALIACANEIGYEYMCIGNHEIDYGMEQLSNMIKQSNATFLNANISYTSNKTNYLENTVPYAVKEYGNIKVGYIGIATPSTIRDTSPSKFMEDGVKVYDFCEGDSDKLYTKVQENINKAKNDGADYVIVLGHFGDASQEAPFRSIDIINNTSGIDVFLDGHSHATYLENDIKDKDGNNVYLMQNGTKLSSFGKITINNDGISVEQIKEVKEIDTDFQAKIDKILEPYSGIINEKLFTNSISLPLADEQGRRMTRNQETAIGNLVSDAFRIRTGADIGYVNGGGIRAGINEGELTYKDIISVLSFGNGVVVKEITGKEFSEMLEYFVCRASKDKISEDGSKSINEWGPFPNLSGVTFTLDTSIETSVKMDIDETFLSVGETRRCSNIMINGEPLDEKKVYTFATHSYAGNEGGCGMLYYLASKPSIYTDSLNEYEVLRYYIEEVLNFDLSAYSSIAHRINEI